MKLLLSVLVAITFVNISYSYEGDEVYDEAPIVDSQEEVYPTQLPSANSTIAPVEDYPQQQTDDVSPYPRNDDTEESSYDDY